MLSNGKHLIQLGISLSSLLTISMMVTDFRQFSLFRHLATFSLFTFSMFPDNLPHDERRSRSMTKDPDSLDPGQYLHLHLPHVKADFDLACFPTFYVLQVGNAVK
jgi:hypothetical protein